MGARSEYIFNNLKESLLWFRILDPVCSCLYIGLASLESPGILPVPISWGSWLPVGLVPHCKVRHYPDKVRLILFSPLGVFLLCILNQAVCVQCTLVWISAPFCCDLARAVCANIEDMQQSTIPAFLVVLWRIELQTKLRAEAQLDLEGGPGASRMMSTGRALH